MARLASGGAAASVMGKSRENIPLELSEVGLLGFSQQ